MEGSSWAGQWSEARSTSSSARTSTHATGVVPQLQLWESNQTDNAKFTFSPTECHCHFPPQPQPKQETSPRSTRTAADDQRRIHAHFIRGRYAVAAHRNPGDRRNDQHDIIHIITIDHQYHNPDYLNEIDDNNHEHHRFINDAVLVSVYRFNHIFDCIHPIHHGNNEVDYFHVDNHDAQRISLLDWSRHQCTELLGDDGHHNLRLGITGSGAKDGRRDTGSEPGLHHCRVQR